MSRWLWNLRHRLAYWIAPGVHKHLSTYASHDECPRTVCQVSASLSQHSYDAMTDILRDVTGA